MKAHDAGWPAIPAQTPERQERCECSKMRDADATDPNTANGPDLGEELDEH